jgi:F-type H+-transporting ATPase subunit b
MIEFNPLTFFAVIFNMTILFVLFRLFFYRPIKQVIDQREKVMQEAIDKNQQLQLDSQEKTKQAFLKLKQAETQARISIEEANQLSDNILNQAKNEAKGKAREIMQIAEEEARSTRESTHKELKREALKVSNIISRKLLDAVFDESMDNFYIQKTLDNLGAWVVEEKAAKQVELKKLIDKAIESGKDIRIITNHPLSQETQDYFSHKLHDVCGQDLNLAFEVSPEIAGGWKMGFGFTDVDFTLDGQIQSMVDQLSSYEQ